MNRAYQVYLYNKSSFFMRRVVLFVFIILFITGSIFLVDKYFMKKNNHFEEQRSKIEVSSRRSATLSVNKNGLEKAFSELPTIKKENKELGRQYIVESLTKIGSVVGFSNFLVESIVEKTNAVSTIYPNLTDYQPSIFEVTITYNAILNQQTMLFLEELNKTINGSIVLVDVETKKVILNVDNDVLSSINKGQKISMLGHKIVLHWIFIK